MNKCRHITDVVIGEEFSSTMIYYFRNGEYITDIDANDDSPTHYIIDCKVCGFKKRYTRNGLPDKYRALLETAFETEETDNDEARAKISGTQETLYIVDEVEPPTYDFQHISGRYQNDELWQALKAVEAQIPPQVPHWVIPYYSQDAMWDKSFSESQDVLEALAKEADEDYEQGHIARLD